MKNVVISCLTCLILALAACTNTSLTESDLFQDIAITNSLLLDRGTTPITAEQAVNVAKLFEIHNGRPATKATETQIFDVYTHRNSEGAPVFYAVNRADGKGFIIISASRKYYPILAYSEKGSFNNSISNPGLDGWINEQVESISYLNSLPDDKTINYTAQWAKYVKNGSVNPITKDGDPINSLRSSFVAYWEALGYNCYALSEQPDYLPNGEYSNFCNTAEIYGNPDYDYMTYSIILEHLQDTSSNTGNLVQTIWDQQHHFNDSIKNANGTDDPYLGCATIAVGQVMRYHQYPTTYNWYAMPTYYATPTTAAFLRDVHDAIGWYVFNNVSDPWTAKNYLVDVGYNDATVESHDISHVRENLMSGYPVIMSGWTGSSIGGHTWVCSGYSSHSTSYSYSLWVVSPYTPLDYIDGYSSYSGVDAISFYYMNWGYMGLNDGWFINDSVKMDNSHNYQYIRNDIINIY